MVLIGYSHYFIDFGDSWGTQSLFMLVPLKHSIHWMFDNTVEHSNKGYQISATFGAVQLASKY